MDVVYEILDALHVFIPVIAIVACVIIFVCGIRSSKSAQPPDEYLQEIKANAAKNKSRNKSSKSSSSLTNSPKTENSVVEKTVKTTSNDVKREKPKVVETKKAKKSTKNSSENATDEKTTGAQDAPESTPWVTVTPKRKQKETVPGSNSVKNVAQDFSPSSDDEQKKYFNEEPAKVEEKIQPSADKIINEVEPTVERQAPAPSVDQHLDEAIEDDEVWSVQTAKDSRYRKTKKRGGSKSDIQNEEIFSNPQPESFSNSELDQKQTSDARRRRNVRRDN